MRTASVFSCFIALILAAYICRAQDRQPGRDDKLVNIFVTASNAIFHADYTENGSPGYLVLGAVTGHVPEPMWIDTSVTGKYVTYECNFKFLDTLATLIINYRDTRGADHYFNFDRLRLVQFWPGSDMNRGQTQIPFSDKKTGVRFDPSKWHALAMSFSKKYLDIYVDSCHFYGMATDDPPAMKGAYTYDGRLPVRFGINSKYRVAIKHIRLAQNDERPRTGKVQAAVFNKLLTASEFVTHDILFEVSKAKIQREAEDYLAALAQWLKQNPMIKLEIAGHTDSDGEEATNKVLSEQRAIAIATELISLGIDGQRLRAVGYGESRPIKSNDTEAGRTINRRVELRKL